VLGDRKDDGYCSDIPTGRRGEEDSELMEETGRFGEGGNELPSMEYTGAGAATLDSMGRCDS
jgi:hypothetical protein